MSEEPQKPKIVVNEDLMAEFNLEQMGRKGLPVKGVEQHDAGRPGDGDGTQVRKVYTLAEMAQEFEFFTTAVICTAGRFDRDPLEEFNRLHPSDNPAELPFVLDYVDPFFAGLGIGLCAGRPVNWDHRLCGIVRERWDLLRNTVAGMAVMERATNFYGRVNFYEMQMLDVPAIKRMAVIEQIPTVPLTVFGVSSTRAFSYIRPMVYPGLPTLVHEDPKADMVLEGASVIGPPPSPEQLLPKKD